MKERPILFSTPMVQAIINGTKTQTRRTINPQPDVITACPSVLHRNKTYENPRLFNNMEIGCPYGKPGDILWVRETWAKQPEYPNELPIFKSTISKEGDELRQALKVKWKPSIHMKKEYAQIWLQVEDVRVQRLQDISEEDAKAEGVERWIETRMKSQPIHYKIYSWYDDPEDPAFYSSTAYISFETLWDSINRPKAEKENIPIAWSDNPYVWAVTFKVLSTTGKPMS